MLWNRSLVMYDADTNSYWSHILGEAMQGELKGEKLEMLPSEMTTWSDWLARHPDSTVLNLSRTSKGYTKEFYRNASHFVFGWSVGFQRYHCPLSSLMKEPLLNLTLDTSALLVTFDPSTTQGQLFSRKVNGRVLTFRLAKPGQMRDEQTSSIWNLVSGQAASGAMKGKRLQRQLGMLSYLQAWMTFYPSSKNVAELEVPPTGDK